MLSEPALNKQNSVVKVMVITSLLLIFLLGAFLRFQYVTKSSFPLNDGGMFYTMIHDLQANYFRLPETTTYNYSNIPYAYPPLSFYVAAGLNTLLRIDLLALFRLYPLVWNLLSMPLFFWLAWEVTRANRFRAVLATGFYAILLSSCEWLIVGGGLTRSPAHTLFIAALAAYLAYLRTGARKWFIASLFFAAWMACHHLEYAWLLVISVLVFSIRRQSWKQFLARMAVYALGVAVLTSPYWLTILGYHGVTPFLAAFSSGDFNPVEMFSRLMALVFTEELLSNYINILVILALFFTLASRQDRKAVLWLAVICVFDNRSAFRALTFPVAILAATSVDYLRVWLGDLARSAGQSDRLVRRFSAGLVVFSIVYPFFLAFLNTLYPHEVLSGLTADEQAAMHWAQASTPADSQFIVIDGAEAWFQDRVAEWFPTLAERQTLNTLQGREWFGKEVYTAAKKLDADFRACARTGDVCAQFSPPADGRPLYAYISADVCNPNADGCMQRLTSIFGPGARIETVYENPAGMIASVELP